MPLSKHLISLQRNVFSCKSLLVFFIATFIVGLQAVTHRCKENANERFTNIKSFTFERFLMFEPGFLSHTYILTNEFFLVMLQGGSAYRILLNKDFKTLLTNADMKPWHAYAQIPSERDISGVIESLYFFSKNDTNSGDYNLELYGSDRDDPKGLFQVAIATSEKEALWSRKEKRYVIQPETRTHPQYALALNFYNEGYAMNEDIYGGTKDYAFYSFLYIPDSELQILNNFKASIHMLDPVESKKKMAQYFYMELTESPTEIQFMPRNLRKASQYDPSKALFTSLPIGFVYDDHLYLFDVKIGCVYNISVAEIGNLAAKYKQGKPFRVNRINYAIEGFFWCTQEDLNNREKWKSVTKCSRTFSGGGKSNDDKPPKPKPPIPKPEGKPTILPNSENSTQPNDDNNESPITWFWILLAIFLLLILIVVAVLLYIKFVKYKRSSGEIKKTKSFLISSSKRRSKSTPSIKSSVKSSLHNSRQSVSQKSRIGSPKSKHTRSMLFPKSSKSSPGSYGAKSDRATSAMSSTQRSILANQPSKRPQSLPSKSSRIDSSIPMISSPKASRVNSSTKGDSRIVAIQSSKPTDAPSTVVSSSTRSNAGMEITLSSKPSSKPDFTTSSTKSTAFLKPSNYADKSAQSGFAALPFSMNPSKNDSKVESTIHVTQSSVPTKPTSFQAGRSTEKATDKPARIVGKFRQLKSTETIGPDGGKTSIDRTSLDKV